MLNLANTKKDLQVPISIHSEDDSSDTDFYYKKLLDKAGLSTINPVFDTELFEFNPISPTLNFFVYFLDYKDMNFNDNVVNNIEPAFSTYINTANSVLYGNTNSFSVYDFKQNNQNVSMVNAFEVSKSPMQVVANKPYLVTDTVRELNRVLPQNNGVPYFYDTFTFPFSKKIDSWKDLPNKFSNRSFLYNSFLLMEIYTSSDPAKQKRIMSIPIFVNSRYMMYERSVNGVKQIRPSFLLKPGCEGYSFSFLKTYNINTFFVKYSFWDALSGVKIPLMASSINTKSKKGIQSATNFVKNNEYVMYKVNYDKLTYQIYEYNPGTKQFDIEAYDYDLYQLAYDDYWAGKIIPNTRPVPLIEPEETASDDVTHTLSVTTNKTLVNVSETLPMVEVDPNSIPGAFPNPLTNDFAFVSLFFNGFYTFKGDLPSALKSMNFQTNTLFNLNSKGDIKAKSYIKKIDTFKITNTHTTDSVILRDVSLTDIDVETVTLESNGVIGKVYNTQEVTNIVNVYQTKWNDPVKKFFAENYITYGDFAPVGSSVINEVIFKYLTLVNEKNSFGVIPTLDYYYNNEFISQMKTRYNVSNPGDYNNTIMRNSGIFASVGQFNDEFNNNIKPLLFTNSNISKQLHMFKNYINTTFMNDSTIKELFANEVDFKPSMGLKNKNDRFSNILDILKDKTKISKSLNDLDFQNELRNLREYMYGLQVECKKDDALIIKPKESFNFDINLFIGYVAAYVVYNIKEPLTFTANLNVTIINQHNNKIKYKIPIKYRLNFQ